MRRAVCFAVALLAVPGGRATAQRTAVETVTVEFRALLPSDATPARARRQALEGALAEAVRQAGGVRVTSSMLSTREEKSGEVRMRDDFSSVVQLDAGALVVDYAVLDSGWTTTRTGAGEEQIYYRVVVRALVAREEGARDPAFAASLTSSVSLLRVRGPAAADNDEVVAMIRSSRDGFVTLVSISDDSATVLIPNAYLTRQRVQAGQSLQLPADEWRDRGVHLRATLPAGVVERSELLVAVVTRAEVAPPGDGRVVDFQRWLVGIPLTERATATALIRVVRQ